MPLAWGGGIFGGGGGEGVSGSGASGRLSLWSGAGTLTSDSGLTYSGTGATFQVLAGSGSSGAPGYSWSAYPTYGIHIGSGEQTYTAASHAWKIGSGYSMMHSTTVGLQLPAATAFGWGTIGGGSDTSLSRIAPGVIGVGTGAAESVAGAVVAQKHAIWSATDTFMDYGGGQNAGYIRFTESAAPVALLSTNGGANIRGLMLGSGYRLSWGTIGGLPDLFLQRRAADTFLFGYEDNGTPTPQTLTFQGSRGATDTNTAGQDATVQGSLGTGTAASGKLLFRVGTPQATGTTQHVASTVLTLQDTGTGGVPAPQVLFENGAVTIPSISFRNAPGLGFSLYPGTAELTATQNIFNWYTGAGYMAQMNAG